MIETTSTAKHFLGVPISRFLREYWQKKPLLVRQAFPDYRAPLSPEDLAGLACEEAALSRLVVHDRKRDDWTVRNGPFAESEFPGLGKADWTLLVQDMDKWDRDVRALLEWFRFLPAWRVDDIMVSFAAPGGSVGAHVDQYDVFLLQAQGRRRWQIDTNPSAPRGFRPDVELKLLQKFTPSHEWLLEPGDMLYLPPGVPHHGEAVDACLTFSIGMRAPSQSELLVDFAEELAANLPDESRYADPDLETPDDPFEIDAAALARVDATLAAMQQVDPARKAEWFGRFITRYRSAGDISAGPRPPDLVAAAKCLVDGGHLLRHPFVRAAWARSGKQAQLFVCGEAYPMGAKSAQILAALDRLDLGNYRRLDGKARLALETLLRRGHYQLQRPAKVRR